MSRSRVMSDLPPSPALPGAVVLRSGVAGLFIAFLFLWLFAWWYFDSWRAGLLLGSVVLSLALICRNQDERVAATGFLLLSAVLYLWGVLRLTFPPQDLALLDRGVDFYQLFFSYALWGPRFCSSYPAVIIRDQFHLELDTAYRLFCGVVMCVTATLSCRTLELFYPGRGRLDHPTRAVIMVFWAGLLCFMNGRLVNCFLGMALIFVAQGLAIRRMRFGFGLASLQAAGVYLTMMSSGTMWIALAQCVGGDIALATWLRSPRILALLAGTVLGYAPFFQRAQTKNLTFFGGRITAMLTHGWGAAFHLDNLITMLLAILASLVVGGLALTAWRKYRERAGDCLLWFNVPVAVMGGAVGYSTGTMVIPAALVLSVALAQAPFRRRSVSL